MWFKLKHYSSALHTRSTLMLELKKAKRAKMALPEKIFSRVWTKPQIHEEYIWLLRFFHTDDAIALFDIGANIGYWSEQFIEYFPKTKILAFEPVPEVYKQYKARYESNPNVKVFNTALGETPSEQPINVAEGFGLTSFFQYDDALQKRNKTFVKQETVKIDVLDNYQNFVKDADAKKIAKIDVQGYEVEVLKGGTLS